MMGPQHRLAGVVAWMATAPALHATPEQFLAGAAIAAITSHGRLSPDMDMDYYWTGRFFSGHRQETHWWMWPTIAFATSLPTSLWWLTAIAVAWMSHLAGDAIFGRIPIWPKSRGRWTWFGLSLTTGGLTERTIARWALIAAIPLLLASYAH